VSTQRLQHCLEEGQHTQQCHQGACIANFRGEPACLTVFADALQPNGHKKSIIIIIICSTPHRHHNHHHLLNTT
jgi:hypothetical protein